MSWTHKQYRFPFKVSSLGFLFSFLSSKFCRSLSICLSFLFHTLCLGGEIYLDWFLPCTFLFYSISYFSPRSLFFHLLRFILSLHKFHFLPSYMVWFEVTSPSVFQTLSIFLFIFLPHAFFFFHFLLWVGFFIHVLTFPSFGVSYTFLITQEVLVWSYALDAVKHIGLVGRSVDLSYFTVALIRFSAGHVKFDFELILWGYGLLVTQ